ncbi:MAG: class I SAM-dependent methyltransferase [Myxococcota bacterium]|nr:class I SAM-dependent methyltransferase [Myxococcota bacterium]
MLLRQVDARYAQMFDLAKSSGLFDELMSRGALVRHQEVDLELAESRDAHAVLRPEPLAFVSHPSEWCFGQLRAAALHTIELQRNALAHGMTLKDASAYNIQFIGHRPVLIDTLSFEKYREGEPWVAYRQFCQHFLAPLARATYCDVRFLDLLRTGIDGVPLDLAAKMLPWRSRLRPSLYAHLHLHARFQERHADAGRAGAEVKTVKVSETGMRGILTSLESAIKGFTLDLPKTEWGDYYSDTNYSDAAFGAKRAAVGAAIDVLQPALVFDLGANTGEFTRLAAERGAFAVAFDIDPVAVERGYRAAVERGDEKLLSLRLDLSNPSPQLGWAHEERESLAARGPADLVLALALVHHLAIGNNVPLDRIAAFFAQLGRALVIEFVPKSDSQVKRLLATREDIFGDYARDSFEAAFGLYFRIDEATPVEGSERTLYRMTALSAVSG